MYKKQLTLTVAVYLAILFTFTACNLAERPSGEAQTARIAEIVEQDSTEREAEIEGIVETKVAEALAADHDDDPTPEPESPTAEPSDQEEPVEPEASEVDPDSPDMAENDMGGGNNMMGGMSGSMDDGAADIPLITHLPDADIDTEQERRALEMLVTHKHIARLLNEQEDWHVEMWFDDTEMVMGIDIFDSDWNWISWGAVEMDADGQAIAITDVATPQTLTAEEYQAGQAATEALVLSDAEVLEVLGDPADWERYTWFDEWEGVWGITFYRGLDEIAVSVDNYDGQLMVGSIRNEALLNEEQQIIDDQNEAISIAWGAEGVDDALYGQDVEWRTFVTHIGGSRYGVSFAAEDEELFFALVDIATGQVVETE